MSTSGSVNFSMNRNQIITAAFRKAGVMGVNQVPNNNMVIAASNDFNALIKRWNMKGYHLWKLDQAILFLDTETEGYTLSPTGDFACYKSDLSETTTTASALSGATTIDIDDTTGFSATKYIGVYQSDDTLHKTTIVSVVGSTVTLTAALTADVDEDAVVVCFENKINKPLRIPQARVTLNSVEPLQNTDIILTPMSNSDYYGLPTKSTTGVPVQYYYQPLLDSGKLYIWPVNDQIANRINMTVETSIEDVDSMNDDADFPAEWTQALIWNLAYEICNDYGVDDTTYMRIQERARQTEDEASWWDVEDVAVQLAPDYYYGAYWKK